jgi:8-hydroxy-5-deazaflavin:NADPH oxidoreductase
MTTQTNIAVIGTGTVGQTLAAGLAALGHAVVVGTRDPAETLARAPFKTWSDTHRQIRIATIAEAAAHGQLLVNATSGGGSVEAFKAARAGDLAGKILIDVANPLDFSRGAPPSLTVCNTDSLAEQLQRAFPDVKVVKTLNTVNAIVMVNPRQLAGGAHTIFVSGNDAGAKQTVTGLLRSLGWEDIVDLGDITTARGPEMFLPLWVRTYAALRTPHFSFKLVR